MTQDVSFYDVLKASYSSRDQQKKALSKYGFKYDSQLSNQDNAVYYNPKQNKLIHAIAGTHRIGDIGTDLYLATGHLKDTDRYKDSHQILRDAKKKYNVGNATVVGHSLGGAIAGYVAGKNDNVYTLDKGATLGQKVRNNENAYRTEGDIVSLANANSKHMTTLENKDGGLLSNVVKTVPLTVVNPILAGLQFGKTILKAHEKDNIRNSEINV